MSCEEARELLPESAESGPRLAGAVEVHLSSCATCSAELAAYRHMLASLGTLRAVEESPPGGYLERTLALVPGAGSRQGVLDWRAVPGRVVDAARRRPAAASVAGAASGVTGVGVIVWRRARRTLQDTARVPSLAPQ